MCDVMVPYQFGGQLSPERFPGFGTSEYEDRCYIRYYASGVKRSPAFSQTTVTRSK